MSDPEIVGKFVGKIKDIELARITSSFVAKISSKELSISQQPVILTTLRLGEGAWIIQAKASVRSTGVRVDPENPQPLGPISVGLYLFASTEGATAEGDAIVTTTFFYASIMVILGIEVSTPLLVELRANKFGDDQKVEISNIVITGIKQDKVITLQL